jgi:hypothetical protein
VDAMSVADSSQTKTADVETELDVGLISSHALACGARRC